MFGIFRKKKPEKCYHCNGIGKKITVNCPHCRGKSYGAYTKTCNNCKGTKKSRCRNCSGTGRYWDRGEIFGCRECAGQGFIACKSCNESGTVSGYVGRCSHCSGTRKGRFEIKCEKCMGSGYIYTKEAVIHNNRVEFFIELKNSKTLGIIALVIAIYFLLRQ